MKDYPTTKFKNTRTLLVLLMAVMFLFAGCDLIDDKEDDPDQLIDPTDANAISQVLTFQSGTQSSDGDAPSSSSSSDAPTVSQVIDVINSSNGSTVPLRFGFDEIVGNSIDGAYVQIAGADNYFTIPYGSFSGSAGEILLPIGIPTNIDEGQFCVNYCVYDASGRVSNVVTTCVQVLRLGTGAVQTSLSWDTATDQDLYVTDPNGEVIYYASSTSTSGGQLDRDDLDGYGPENIFWLEGAPDGEYQVAVHDYSRTSTTNTFYVTVNGPNQTKNFNGSTINGSRVDVVTFTKSGANLTF